MVILFRQPVFWEVLKRLAGDFSYSNKHRSIRLQLTLFCYFFSGAKESSRSLKNMQSWLKTAERVRYEIRCGLPLR
jgi:hypothetical protein